MSYHDNVERDYVLSVLAQNNSGVLLRIAGLFSRRCYNIKSIVAAQTEDAAHSQMIIVVQGDDRIVRQVDKQLSKLVEVEQVTVLDDDNAVVREHLLMKVERTDATTDHLMAIANVFHACLLYTSDRRTVRLKFVPLRFCRPAHACGAFGSGNGSGASYHQRTSDSSCG